MSKRTDTIPFLNYSPFICERCKEFAKADKINHCARGKELKFTGCLNREKKK